MKQYELCSPLIYIPLDYLGTYIASSGYSFVSTVTAYASERGILPSILLRCTLSSGRLSGLPIGLGDRRRKDEDGRVVYLTQEFSDQALLPFHIEVPSTYQQAYLQEFFFSASDTRQNDSLPDIRKFFYVDIPEPSTHNITGIKKEVKAQFIPRLKPWAFLRRSL